MLLVKVLLTDGCYGIAVPVGVQLLATLRRTKGSAQRGPYDCQLFSGELEHYVLQTGFMSLETALEIPR